MTKLSKMEIWHANDPTYGIGPDPAWPDEYTKVAFVHGACLGLAYARTQNADGPWWQNEEVTKLVERASLRSTAVGDVVVIYGVAHRYTADGWQELDPSS